MKRWVVVFQNYEPPEIDSFWDNEEEADQRADELNENYDWSPWEAREWCQGPGSKP